MVCVVCVICDMCVVCVYVGVGMWGVGGCMYMQGVHVVCTCRCGTCTCGVCMWVYMCNASVVRAMAPWLPHSGRFSVRWSLVT
jgi:hypothetical protein